MFINSDFRDYYDYLAYTERDKKIVYNRKTEYFYKNRYKDADSIPAWIKTLLKRSFAANGGGYFTVFIGGKIEYGRSLAPAWREPNKILWGPTALESNRRGRYDFSVLGMISPPPTDYSDRRFLDVEEITQSVAPIIYLSIINGTEWELRLNPSLSEINFNWHPTKIYQELLSALSGKEPTIPQMNNKQKIEAAGFDLKTSFRGKRK